MSGWAAIVLIAVVAIAAAAIFRAGRNAGGFAEQKKIAEAKRLAMKQAENAKGRMLDAGAAAPRDRDSLIGRLRYGSF
jgi:hypothetical protein